MATQIWNKNRAKSPKNQFEIFTLNLFNVKNAPCILGARMNLAVNLIFVQFFPKTLA